MNKTFITYIEVFEQTAHDAGLHAFAKQRGIDPRRAHRGQVRPANTGANPLAYYATHGQQAAAMVGDFMHGMLPFAIIVTIVATLIEVQPDLGTTAIIVGVSACVFFVAGANLLHILLLGFAAAKIVRER